MLNLSIASRLGIAKKYDHQLKWLSNLIQRTKISFRNKDKIFVIGFNKTGTTTLFYALGELGYIMSNQHDFERLYSKYVQGKIKKEDILKNCLKYEVFQDIPFSLPKFYKEVDKKYSKCKFILTVRSSSNVWFNSFEKYYGGVEELKEDNYIEGGFLYNTFKEAYSSENLNKKDCILAYEQHIKEVKESFISSNGRLLILDVSDDNSYYELCRFLGKKPIRQNFQWKNKTKT